MQGHPQYQGQVPQQQYQGQVPQQQYQGQVPQQQYQGQVPQQQYQGQVPQQQYQGQVPQQQYQGQVPQQQYQGQVPQQQYQGQVPQQNLGPAAATTTYAPLPAAPVQRFVADPIFNNPCRADQNGLRWTWSTFPTTDKGKPGAVKGQPGSISLPEMVVPLACMFTPLHPIADCPSVTTAPPLCKNCGATWSRHGRLDVPSQYWACLSCFSRNPLPDGFDPNHPALHHDTVEYIQHTDSESRPTFIFVVDTCVPQDELDALRRNLSRCVDWLPPYSLVGFVSFGHGVTVWELGCEDLNKCYSLRGTRKYSPTELSAMLNITDASSVIGRFLCPLDECEFALTSIIEELSVDPFPVAVGFRPQRATGTAVDVSVRLLELLNSPATTGKVIMFTGGPCTRGPGVVVGTKRDEMLRFHRDFMDGNVPHYQAAHDFYNEVERRLLDVNSSLDVFVESFDQVGITEMRRCVNNTGGVFVCGDTFDHEMFSESFQRFLHRVDTRTLGANEVGNAFAVKINVHMSGDTLISGAIGPCDVDAKAEKSTASRQVSPHVIGSGNTSQWRLSSADQALTITFLFDTETLQSSGGEQPQVSSGARRFFQFQTSYVTANGQHRLRVTSVTQPVAPTRDPQFFVANMAFDQSCAAAVIARMAVWMLENQDNRWESTKRWIDRLLVVYVKRFGTFTVGNPDSLRLAPGMSLFPSFMFNLRRSEYFMVLNISPDETTFKRHWIMRDPTDSCVVMIQPTLDTYTLLEPTASPVPLDSTSLVGEHVLLMDAFFNIHILWGSVVYQWMKANYQDQEEYSHFKAQLDAPERDAQELLKRRFPYPRFSRTDVNGSESRHVKTRMNPTTTHNNQQPGAGAPGEVIYTDDASISRFMQTLKAAVVAPDIPGQ